MTLQIQKQVGLDQCSFVRESDNIFTFPCGLEINKTLAAGFPSNQWSFIKSAHQMHHWVCEDIFGAGRHGAYWTFWGTIESNEQGMVTERIICPE